MPEEVAGSPYWELEFSADATLVGSPPVFTELPRADVTDLVIMSHGWNSAPDKSRRLYRRFFTEVGSVAQRTGAAAGRKLGTVGVIWPSMRWLDEPEPAEQADGQLASVGAPAGDPELVEALKAVYPAAEQQAALDSLAALLRDRPRSLEALASFHRQLAVLAGPADFGAAAPEDSGEAAILAAPDTEELFDQFAALDTRPAADEGMLLGVGDRFGKLWKGAREALRAVTYWEMKRRAGVVGRDGLAPAVIRLHDSTDDLRVHLVGHSFGARLVSFVLAGLPTQATGSASPIKSVLLLQGAFSHFAFAPSLPHARERSGALAGMADRVDGPLLATFTKLDTAVGHAYPLASALSRDDAAGLDNQLFRWGAVGHDGFQAVDAAGMPLAAVGTPYQLGAKRFVNLDANAVIKNGGPPSGSHSDIVHPEVAWAVLSAAGLAKSR